MSFRSAPPCPKCLHDDTRSIPSNLGDIWFCDNCKTEFDAYTKEILASGTTEKDYCLNLHKYCTSKTWEDCAMRRLGGCPKK